MPSATMHLGAGIAQRRGVTIASGETTTRPETRRAYCSSWESSGERRLAVEDDANRLAHPTAVRHLNRHTTEMTHRTAAGGRLGGGRRLGRCLMPAAIASDSARHWWTRARLCSPEIQGESPGAAEVRPSSDIASFSVTSGNPVRACLRNGWLSSRAAVASSPAASSTSTPPSRRIPGPRPAAFSLGSSEAITTREIPASRIASVQGGCRPVCAQGSSVTYIVAPAGSFPLARGSPPEQPARHADHPSSA